MERSKRARDPAAAVELAERAVKAALASASPVEHLRALLVEINGLGDKSRSELVSKKAFRGEIEKVRKASLGHEDWVVLGNVYFALDMMDHAMEAYSCAAESGRTREVLNNLGVAASRLGLYDESVGYFEEALRLDQRSSQTWFNLGKTHYRLGNLPEATSAFKRAVDAEPGSKSAWNNLGVCLRKDGLIEEALVAYERALAIDETYVWAWDNRARALMEVERYKESLASFDRALAIDPGYAPSKDGRDECAKKMKGSRLRFS